MELQDDISHGMDVVLAENEAE